MTVHPATAGNVNEQYVCGKLHVIITPNVSFKATLECDVLDINCRSDLPTQEEESEGYTICFLTPMHNF